jgi:phosphatidate phosphatase APP1
MSRDRGWERWAGRVARGVERRVDEARTRVLGTRAARQIVPYLGFGNHEEVFVSGRVLADQPTGPVDATDHWLTNLGRTLRHLESNEVTGARVRIRLHGSERIAVSDDEGYFRAWLPLATAHVPAAPEGRADGAAPRRADLHAQRWHDADLEVIEPLHAAASQVRATGRVLVPPAHASAGVISDIDDTVIRTDATRLLMMLKRTLLENARTRLPFPGVAEFYEGLQGGSTGADGNPVFYVSSSPWNLYPVLTDFLEHQSIPAGPLLLRDWGISERGILPTRHGEHKLGAIRQIMDCYPGLPFILIGDSGQEDPEIYRTVVHDYGARILAVYIRNVTPGPDRVRAVGELAEEVREAGSELLLSDDTAASAVHAAGRGWLTPAALAAVHEAVRAS